MSTLDDQINATIEKITDLDRQSIAYRRILEILQEMRDRGSAPELEKKKSWMYPEMDGSDRPRRMTPPGYISSEMSGGYYTIPVLCPKCNVWLVEGQIHVCI